MKSLRDVRDSLALTQREMASRMKTSLSYYIKVETGAAEAGRGFIMHFHDAFPNISTDIFFGGDTDDKND